MKINRNAAAVRFCTLKYGDVFTFMGTVFMVVCDEEDISANAVNLETFTFSELNNDALVIPYPNAFLTLEQT